MMEMHPNYVQRKTKNIILVSHFYFHGFRREKWVTDKNRVRIC